MLTSSATIVGMEAPAAAAASAPRRVVLVPVEARSDELVRRYRLARLRIEGRQEHRRPALKTFSHLERMHD